MPGTYHLILGVNKYFIPMIKAILLSVFLRSLIYKKYLYNHNVCINILQGKFYFF